MRDREEKIGLVIPCFNEEKRLSAFDLAGIPASLHLLFVNDGSTDRTASILDSWKDPKVSRLHLTSNRGKAEAVRQGMGHISTLSVFPDLSWVGYWDADFSAPLSEIEPMLHYWELCGGKADTIWGSRVAKLGSDVRRNPSRHVLGRLFSTAVGVLFPEFKVYDSQCGAKLFRKNCLSGLFSEPFLSPWIFDVELLLRLKGRSALEYPLSRWQDKGNSKFSIGADGLRALWDLFRIRRHYR